MNDFNEFEKMFDGAKSESLLEHERVSIRGNLELFMSDHPAAMPFTLRVVETFRSAIAIGRFPALNLRPVAAALVLVLSVGAGTSYAAEGALPGDPLYALKININEPVRGTLAVSSKAKAEWNTERIERRLEESESLAAAGRFDATSSSIVAAGIDASANDFDESVVSLTEEQSGQADVADVQSNLEAKLAAHARVLGDLAEIKPDAKDHIKQIVAIVNARAEGASTSLALAEKSVVASEGGAVHLAAAGKKAAARSSLDKVRSLEKESRTTLGPSSADATSMAADRAEQSIGEGDQSLIEGDYKKAFSEFQNAAQAAEEAATDVEARINIKNKHKISIEIHDDSGVDGDAQAAAAAGLAASSTATTTATTTEEQSD